ncbi:MAG: hypothetical protein JSS69_04675 [Acidobacteria bacterium]|nr:hypothetical protein [Acidobacteriota bacterium]MBS1865192.1 hypothetical protein [Acidobacteriota bacterium]
MKRVFSHPLIALALGLWLRLFFLLKYPVASSGDTVLYEDLATNWFKHHVYAMTVDGSIVPVDIRMPGYPAFLSLIYSLTGRVGPSARTCVMFAQAAIDLLGCLFIACAVVYLFQTAFGLANKNPAFRAAFWFAALCPFLANYNAVLLTETIVTCVSAIAFCLLIRLAASCSELFDPIARLKASWDKSPEYWAALFGLSVGAMTLFRPESPIFLISAWLALAWFFWKHRELRRWFKLALISALFCVATLSPWAIRNAITLHEFQFLAPKDANLPSEHPPYGFMAWEKTWLYRLNDCYDVTWKLNEEPINLSDIPPRAFDSDSEKLAVAALIAQHNQSLSLTPEQDAAFGQIAKQRSSRHPLRTFLWIPFQRALTIWFTPRIELLPLSGNVFPLRQSWEDDSTDQLVTAGFFLLNILYLVLALCGFLRLWKLSPRIRPVLFAIAVYLLLRTAFLTTVEAPEPRYVLVCFPLLLALAAAAIVPRPAQDVSSREKSA